MKLSVVRGRGGGVGHCLSIVRGRGGGVGHCLSIVESGGVLASPHYLSLVGSGGRGVGHYSTCCCFVIVITFVWEVPVKMRTAMKWRIQRSAQLPTGEDCGGGRQSPLFEDFSDDEDFDCLSDVKSLSREHRLSSGSTSLPPGPKTPNTPPSSSPRRGNWLSSPLNMSSGSPHIAAASSHSPHHYGGGTSSPFESFKVEAVDNDGEQVVPIVLVYTCRYVCPMVMCTVHVLCADELSRDSSQLNAGVDQCASPSEDSLPTHQHKLSKRR